MTRTLITSALPYINGVKHLGNLVGSMLPADVYARYLRLQGDDVLYVCATDEHGTPAELAAVEAGVPVAEYCAEQHAIQARLGEQFGLSWDVFGRSSSPQNHDLTQYFGRVLDANGLVEEGLTRQMYSIDDGRFLPDRYIIGTCPYCGYARARGDQCENCGNLLDPTELIEPRSAISGSTNLEVRESKHLFLLQSKLVPELREWLGSKTDWPLLSRSIGLKWLDEGLGDRSITRDLSWGVPVDRPGYEGKVYYVWFDAPIEYISATREWADARGEPDAWRSWWYDADDVRYVEFMAKDNVPFHTIGFPCTIIGSREPWKLVDFLKAFNWLTYYGGKFSTSQGIGVFMDDALEILPPDVWRYYLIANAPESDDSSFTWETFAVAVNKDLADTFGNFVNRALTFTARRFDGMVPAGGAAGEEESRLQTDIDAGIAALSQRLAEMEFRKAAAELRALWSRANEYFDRKQPWVQIKTDPDDAALTLRTCVNLIALFGRLSAPIMPFTAERVLDALAVDTADRSWPAGFDPALLTPGHAVTVPGVLFEKLTDEQIAGWQERFGAGGFRMTDAAAFRAQFPVLEQKSYLNAGTEGPLPGAVGEAVRAELDRELTGGRCGADYFEALKDLAAQSRAGYAAVLGAGVEEVALTGSTTDGVNTIIGALDLRPGDEILTSDEEHPGLLAPLARVRALRGARIRVVPFAELPGEVTSATRLVACSHVSWVSGRVLDTAALKATGASVLLDAAQGIGAVPVDVRELGCDYYAASGQKWLCGPEGSGCLYVNPERLEELTVPWPGYGSLLEPAAALTSPPAEGAARFDHGFPPAMRSVWALASMKVFADAGWDWVHTRSAELAARLADALAERGLTVGPRGRSTLVSWVVEDAAAEVERLGAQGIVVRSIPAFEMVRASVGAWSSEEELDRLADLAAPGR